MKKLLAKTFKFLYFGGCFFVMGSITAQAYIDPSVVTYIIQAVAGALIAIGALITVFRHKIVALFKGKKKDDAPQDEIEFKDVDAGDSEEADAGDSEETGANEAEDADAADSKIADDGESTDGDK